MTQTVQFCSSSQSETSKEIIKTEMEDNMKLLVSVYDSLNNLYEILCELNYEVTQKVIEQNNITNERNEIKRSGET